MFILEIEADWNDADYVMQKHTVTEEDIEKVKKFLAVIQHKRCKKSGRFEWRTGERVGVGNSPEELYPELSKEQIAMFEDLLPWAEYGLHTVESIVVYPQTRETKL